VQLEGEIMSYAPNLGRWIQPDPVGYPDGMSRYEYLTGAPTGAVDPFGLQANQAQPGGNPAPGGTSKDVEVRIRPNMFQVFYTGNEKVIFLQTVEIVMDVCHPEPPAEVREKEKADHGGKDPFEGPVGDNPSGDPKKPYGGRGRRRPNGGDLGNEKQMTDYPNFPPPYPASYCPTKQFVTTVVTENGKVLAEIRWSVHRHRNGKIEYVQDK
jgi:uncharacterized protein RhaS with RHS repeats